VGVDFPASVTCDKCGVKKSSVKVVVTKLKPQVEMHFKMPNGWNIVSLPESGEMLTTCPSCPPTLVSIPPVNPADVGEDPTTDPTLRPPPLPKI
jgi:hypothetical protein